MKRIITNKYKLAQIDINPNQSPVPVSIDSPTTPASNDISRPDTKNVGTKPKSTDNGLENSPHFRIGQLQGSINYHGSYISSVLDEIMQTVERLPEESNEYEDDTDLQLKYLLRGLQDIGRQAQKGKDELKKLMKISEDSKK